MKPQIPSPERAAYLRRAARERRLVRGSRLLIVVAFFLLWEAAAACKWIDPFLMSSPSRMLATLGRLAAEGNLLPHIGITCMETVAGFLLGTLLGTAIAMLLWWMPRLARITEPLLVTLNSLPKIALGPVFIVWMGPGTGAIVVMGLAISLIVTVLEVYHGFVQTDADKVRLVESMGGSRWQVLTKVVLPANLPTVVNALKVNIGLSWVGVITGEYLVSRAGIGYLIVYGGQVFRMDLVMASVLVLAVLAALMYLGVVAIERRIRRRMLSADRSGTF